MYLDNCIPYDIVFNNVLQHIEMIYFLSWGRMNIGCGVLILTPEELSIQHWYQQQKLHKTHFPLQIKQIIHNPGRYGRLDSHSL